MIPIRDLPKRVYRSARSRLGLAPPLVRQTLLGTSLTLREGAIALRPDYDYGWNYALLCESKVFFDVGCNVGFDSIAARLVTPEGHLVAIDANPKALAVAAENLILNGLANPVRFVLGFVSDAAGEEVTFYSVGTGSAGGRFKAASKTAAARGSFTRVRATTLDAIADELGLAPDFVKIDVEGAEAEVLGGARELTRRCRPRFLVEMHSPPERRMLVNGEMVLRWCAKAGYDAYYLAEHQLVTSASAFAHRGRCHLLLLPAGEPYPGCLAAIAQGDSMENAREARGRWLASRDPGAD